MRIRIKLLRFRASCNRLSADIRLNIFVMRHARKVLIRCEQRLITVWKEYGILGNRDNTYFRVNTYFNHWDDKYLTKEDVTPENWDHTYFWDNTYLDHWDNTYFIKEDGTPEIWHNAFIYYFYHLLSAFLWQICWNTIE